MVDNRSRRDFLRKSTGLAVAGAASAFLIGGKESILRADPTIDQATPRVLSVDQMRFSFRSIQDHENDHSAFLAKALGKSARPKPNFHNLTMSDLGDFIDASQAFEATGVGAYLGALPYIDDQTYLASAGTIALVEARHTS